MKIADFGTVTDKSTEMTANKGTASYMAPEVFKSGLYSEKCDVYIWGMVLWEVWKGEIPFKTFDVASAIMYKVITGQFPVLSTTVSEYSFTRWQ